MIKNFDEIKKQLADLTDVINGYKSEAVQLKIIESLLSGFGPEKAHGTPIVPIVHAPAAKAKKKSAAKTTGADDAKGAKSASKKPKKVILDLIEDGYFAEHRLIGDVQNHIKDSISLSFSV